MERRPTDYRTRNDYREYDGARKPVTIGTPSQTHHEAPANFPARFLEIAFFTNHTPMPKAIPTKNLFLFTFRRMVAQVTPPKGFPCIGFNINGVPISTHQSRSGNTIAGIRTTGAGLYATFARRQKSINVFKPATLKPRINAIQTVFYIPETARLSGAVTIM